MATVSQIYARMLNEGKAPPFGKKDKKPNFDKSDDDKSSEKEAGTDDVEASGEGAEPKGKFPDKKGKKPPFRDKNTDQDDGEDNGDQEVEPKKGAGADSAFNGDDDDNSTSSSTPIVTGKGETEVDTEPELKTDQDDAQTLDPNDKDTFPGKDKKKKDDSVPNDTPDDGKQKSGPLDKDGDGTDTEDDGDEKNDKPDFGKSNDKKDGPSKGKKVKDIVKGKKKVQESIEESWDGGDWHSWNDHYTKLMKKVNKLNKDRYKTGANPNLHTKYEKAKADAEAHRTHPKRPDSKGTFAFGSRSVKEETIVETKKTGKWIMKPKTGDKVDPRIKADLDGGDKHFNTKDDKGPRNIKKISK